MEHINPNCSDCENMKAKVPLIKNRIIYSGAKARCVKGHINKTFEGLHKKRIAFREWRNYAPNCGDWMSMKGGDE